MGTAVSLEAVRLEGNRANVTFRVIYIYILLTEREHCIKVFRGFVKRRQFFLKLFLNGTLEHWNVSLVALAAVRFDLFHALGTLWETCHSIKTGRSIPFDLSTLTYFESFTQSLLKKTGIKKRTALPSFFSMIFSCPCSLANNSNF